MVSVTAAEPTSQDGNYRLPTCAPPGAVLEYSEVRHTPPPPYNGSIDVVASPPAPSAPTTNSKPRVTFNLPPPTPTSSQLSPRRRHPPPERGCCFLLKRSILPALICIGIVIVIVILAIFVFKGNGTQEQSASQVPQLPSSTH